jgi:hypothetical protein
MLIKSHQVTRRLELLLLLVEEVENLQQVSPRNNFYICRISGISLPKAAVVLHPVISVASGPFPVLASW